MQMSRRELRDERTYSTCKCVYIVNSQFICGINQRFELVCHWCYIYLLDYNKFGYSK